MGHLVANPQPLNVTPPTPLPAIAYESDWRHEMKKEIQHTQEQLCEPKLVPTCVLKFKGSVELDFDVV